MDVSVGMRQSIYLPAMCCLCLCLRPCVSPAGAEPTSAELMQAEREFNEGFATLVGQFIETKKSLFPKVDRIVMQKLDCTRQDGKEGEYVYNGWSFKRTRITRTITLEDVGLREEAIRLTTKTLDSSRARWGGTHYHFPTHQLIFFRGKDLIFDLRISWEGNTLSAGLPLSQHAILNFEDTELRDFADRMLPLSDWEKSIVGSRLPRAGWEDGEFDRFWQGALSAALRRLDEETPDGELRPDLIKAGKKYHVRMMADGSLVDGTALRPTVAPILGEEVVFARDGGRLVNRNHGRHVGLDVEAWRWGDEIDFKVVVSSAYLAAHAFEMKARFDGEGWVIESFTPTWIS